MVSQESNDYRQDFLGGAVAPCGVFGLVCDKPASDFSKDEFRLIRVNISHNIFYSVFKRDVMIGELGEQVYFSI